MSPNVRTTNGFEKVAAINAVRQEIISDVMTFHIALGSAHRTKEFED